MIYPINFESKTGFDKIRQKLKSHCLSALGIDKAEEMAFSNNYDFLTAQLNLASEFKEICLTEDNFPVSYFFDLIPVLKKLKVDGTFPEMNELYDLRRSLETINAVYSFFKEKKENKYPCLCVFAKDLKLYPFVSGKINAIITNQGKIKNNASSQLAQIRHEIISKGDEVSRRMRHIMKQAQAEGWVDEGSEPAMRDGRLVIPVTTVHKRRIQGFIHDESATGKTTYIEPAEIVELNNDIRELEYAERREIVKILIKFADEVRPYIDDLLLAYDFLGEIDFLRAKALLAIEIDAVKPPLIDNPVLEWYNAIHPLLYLHLKNENKEVVPLNIRLNKKQRILVISGPNAGGKSVCLQTVGLLQYMLQCGLLIPLKETSETGIFDNLFIDIGDEQSIENDLSTYSSHLQNMKYFLKNTNNKTLFLIDEFGTGTEPMLGGAVAESVLEAMNLKLCFGVVTTHYTNLKHFALSAEGIANGAMLFDAHNLQPLFKLEIGEPGSSFAFEIARKIGLPEEILQSAMQKVGEEHIDFDRHLKEIIRDKYYWKQRREQIKESGKRLDSLEEKYLAELEEIRILRKEIVSKAKSEAQEMLAATNRQIENTIREIKEAKAEKERTKEIRGKLDEMKQKISGINPEQEEQITRKIEQLKRRGERKKKQTQQVEHFEENKPDPDNRYTIRAGDKVRLYGQDTVGEVLDVNEKSIMVAFGQMITTLHENRLEKISNNEYRKIQKSISADKKSSDLYDVSEKKIGFKSQLDVRGMRGDEAIQKVAEFIDNAIVVGVGEVKILHGKGNGILRQIIRDYLSTIDLIESFADEHVDFGGAGITLVRFGE
jgi:DNA mismatch repair protein MutS2